MRWEMREIYIEKIGRWWKYFGKILKERKTKNERENERERKEKKENERKNERKRER